MPEFDERFHFLPCEGNDLINFLDLLNVIGNADDLQGKFIYFILFLVLIVAYVDTAIRSFPEHKGFILCIMIIKLFFILCFGTLASDDFMVRTFDDSVKAVDIALSMLAIGKALRGI
jgi:hypothetical protein